MLGARQYTHKFASRVAALLPKLIVANVDKKEKDRSCAKELFAAYPMSTWHDADLGEMAKYMRASTSLHIPPGWRDFLPTEIPMPDSDSESD